MQNRNAGAGCAARAIVLVILAVATSALAAAPTRVDVYADGLFNPRGLAFAEDGALYVAEAGRPGEVVVPLPAAYGKAPLGDTGRISVVRGGVREDVIVGLPNMGLYSGVEILGPSGLATDAGRLFYVTALHVTELPRLYEIVEGKRVPFAEVGAFNEQHPPPPSNGDAAIGNPYDMTRVGSDIYVTDGNYNRILKIDRDGQIAIFAAYENSPVTTGLTSGPDGALYVAQFSPAPYVAGSSTIDRIAPDGKIEAGYVPDLTNAVDAVFDREGTLYVLQFASAFNADTLIYKPHGGKLLRVRGDRTTEEVVTGLTFPTAVIVGPDGALYVSNFGHQANDGQGQVLRIEPGVEAVTLPVGLAPSGKQWQEPVPKDTLASLPAPEPDTVVVRVSEGSDVMKWGYDPAELTVRAGTKVTFVNLGQVPHTATATNGGFDTGLFSSGESRTVVLNDVGEHPYLCTPHPWMKGKVTVEAAARQQADAPAAQGAKQMAPQRPPLGFEGASALQIAMVMLLTFAALFALTRVFARKEA